MADASPQMPSWVAEAAGTIAAAVAARLAWLLRAERKAKPTDRRGTAAAAVLAEIERSQPAFRLPTPWVDQVRAEASNVSSAIMRAHEDRIQPNVERLSDLAPRVSALEDRGQRLETAMDRFMDQLREDRREERKHFDARLDALAEALSCRACGGQTR